MFPVTKSMAPLKSLYLLPIEQLKARVSQTTDFRITSLQQVNLSLHIPSLKVSQLQHHPLGNQK